MGAKDMYLPTKIRGNVILVKVRAEEYRVDNSALQSSKVGVGYRWSKSMEDLHPRAFAQYGSVVAGSNEGDGWIKIKVKKEDAPNELRTESDAFTQEDEPSKKFRKTDESWTWIRYRGNNAHP